MALDGRIHPIPLKSDIESPLLPRKRVEAHIGYLLPDSLIDILRDGGHATTFEEGVEIKPQQPNPLAGQDGSQDVLTVLGLSSGKAGIAKTYDQYKDRLGKNYIPVASDGLGNLFVLNAKNQKILFWHHECPDGEDSLEAFTDVADNFTQFVSGLRPKPEAEYKMEGSKVSGVKRFSFDF
jgi:hypothetical protein